MRSLILVILFALKTNAEFRKDSKITALHHPSNLRDKSKKVPFTAPILEAATADFLAP